MSNVKGAAIRPKIGIVVESAASNLPAFMKLLFGYVRVSTVKQSEHGSSLQEQRAAIESYARRYDLTIVRWFEETETAAKRGRSVFTRMLAAVQAGEADGVIIHKIDRGARNLRDWADLGELIDRGIDVHFAHESLDLHSRGGRLSADIQAVVAADYIRNLRDEVRKGFYGRLKQGLYPLPAPIGYVDRGGGLAKEPDPIAGPLVRAAFELYATGVFTLDQLGVELHRRGLRSHSGKRLSRSGLSGMLNNPFYIGLIAIRNTKELFQGVHTPLITKDLFDRVQAVLDGRAPHHGLRNQFLFQKLLRCAGCRYRLTAERQKGFVYYRCHTKSCPKTCLREETVDRAMVSQLEAITLSDEEVNDLRTLALELRAEWEVKRGEELGTTKLNLAKAEERLARLTDAYLDGALDRDLFENRKKSLLLERKDLQERFGRMAADHEPLTFKLSKFLELARRAPLSYETGNLFEKRQVVQSVTSNLTVDRENVAIALRSPFEALANREKIAIGGPFRNGLRTQTRKIFGILIDYFKKEPDEDYREAA